MVAQVGTRETASFIHIKKRAANDFTTLFILHKIMLPLLSWYGSTGEQM